MNRWFIELDVSPKTQMKYVTPWLDRIKGIGFPMVIYPAKSSVFEPIDGIWRTGIVHRLVVVNVKDKIVDTFLNEIDVPPPPPNFRGKPNEFYMNYNIPVQTELDSIVLVLNDADFDTTLSGKIDECFVNKSCYIFLDVDPLMSFIEYITRFASIKEKISALRNSFSMKEFKSSLDNLRGRDRYLIESRYPILIELLPSKK